MIEIKGLYKGYGPHQVLKGVDLQVGPGEIYGFIGHNGAGKSTTMNILAGLIGFDQGTCIVGGEVREGRKGYQVLKTTSSHKTLGYLPEEPRFYLQMNSWEYLDLIGGIGGDSRQIRRQRAGACLEMVGLIKDAKRPIGHYSRGMKQRLGLAVAIYHNPQVLLLDEPSSALDPLGRQEVVGIIQNLKNLGKTIFLSTHILSDIEQVCTRVGILHGGKIVLEDDLDTLIRRYTKPVYTVSFRVPANHLATQLGTHLGNHFLGANFSIPLEVRWVSETQVEVAAKAESLFEALVPIAGFVEGVSLQRPTLEAIYAKVVSGDV